MNSLNFNIQDLTAACSAAIKSFHVPAVAECNAHSDRVFIKLASGDTITIRRWELLLLKNEHELQRFIGVLLRDRGAL